MYNVSLTNVENVFSNFGGRPVQSVLNTPRELPTACPVDEAGAAADVELFNLLT